MFPAHIFNPEIIDYQREGDRAGKMSPQAWCMFTLIISKGEETLLEKFVSQYACLGKAPYDASHFEIYIPILCKLVQIVLFLCPGWEER